MDLLALVAFHEIVGHGGIGRASRATGQPKTTLSRRLRELEDALGVRLVERGPKTFRLTEEGAMLHRQTGGLLAEIEDVGQALAGGLSRPRGPLRVSVPELFADLYMGRIAARFVARYPEIALEVLCDNRLIDPLNEGVDLVVRVNPHLDESLVGRIVMREETLLVAPPSLERPRRQAGDEASAGVPAIILPTTAGMPVVARRRGERDRGLHSRACPQVILGVDGVAGSSQRGGRRAAAGLARRCGPALGQAGMLG